MTLLQPAWLGLLALAAVVLALHARRRRRIEVSSVFLWRLIEPSSTRRRTFRWPSPGILLALQLLAVALVALALAQPRFGAASDPQHTIFVVDGSGSMRAADGETDRFGHALRYLEDRLPGEPGRLSVVLAGQVPDIVAARQPAASGILPVLASLGAGDGAADWSAASGWIGAIVRADERTRIVVLTDGADAGDAGIATAFPGAEVERVLFGGAATANAALAASLDPVAGEPGRWSVSGEVVLAGAAVSAVTVWFEPAGTDGFLEWATIPLNVDPDGVAAGPRQRVAIAFAAELDLPGAGLMRLSIPADALPMDDQVRFVVPDAERMVRVLLLGVESPALVRALEAAGGVELFAADVLPADAARFDLVVVNDATVDRAVPTNVLWLARGGMAGAPVPTVLGNPAIDAWRDDHPLSRSVGWRDVDAGLAYAVPRLAGADVIAESGGLPLVQARTTRFGREVRVAVDLSASPWTGQPAFPLFIADLIAWLSVPRADEAAACNVGVTCAFEARLAAGRVVHEDGTLAYAAPAGVEWLPAGADASFVPLRGGFYRLEASAGGTTIAVNASVAEAVIARRADAPGTPAAAVPLRVPPWAVLVATTLAVLLLEAWLAGRGPERFLLRPALARGAPHAGRRRALIALRLGALAFLVAALLQLPVPRLEPSENWVLVASLSTGGAMNPAATGMGWAAPGGGAGAVLADLATPPAAGTARAGAEDAIDLEAAVRLAAAMLPADRAGRVVLAGDGNETTGQLGAAIGALRVRGVAVDVVPENAVPAGEVLVRDVSVPAPVRSGDTVALDAVLWAAGPTQATVAFIRNGETVIEQDVSLVAGNNRVGAAVEAGDAGETLFEVAVSAAGDTEPANNRNGVAIDIGGPPRVLVVTPDVAWGQFFLDALGVQGVSGSVVVPDRAPFYMADWLAYDAVVLMNVPAIDLTGLQQDLLEAYVQVHGRGLLILGGENAFGPGGYYQTPLERISPLSARIPHRAPQAAMVFVLDRSGSMQAAVGTGTRLDIAREATLSAIELLHEESQVAVVVFDSESRLLVPLQERKDEAAIAEALAPLTPGGGTALFPALTAGFEALEGATGDARHMVVITDGLIEPADYPALLGRIRETGITVSVVAVGGEAGVAQLEPIARLGGGAFHATRDFNALPSILSQEALLLSGSPVREATTEVFWVDRNAPFLAGMPDVLPPLESYVATTSQPGASVHLAVIDEEDETVPVLASWRYGAGQVLAFGSHGAGSGTQGWLDRAFYPLLWAQTVRQFIATLPPPGLTITHHRSGDEVVAVAALLSLGGVPEDGATLSVTVDGGDTTATTPTGGAAVALGVLGPGTHQVLVEGGEMSASARIHIGYGAALDFARADPDRLMAMATATGGSLVTPADASRAPSETWRFAPEMRLWTLLALALFLADLVTRYSPSTLRVRRLRPAGTSPAAATVR